jgi:hypothetical protein
MLSLGRDNVRDVGHLLAAQISFEGDKNGGVISGTQGTRRCKGAWCWTWDGKILLQCCTVLLFPLEICTTHWLYDVAFATLKSDHLAILSRMTCKYISILAKIFCIKFLKVVLFSWQPWLGRFNSSQKCSTGDLLPELILQSTSLLNNLSMYTTLTRWLARHLPWSSLQLCLMCTHPKVGLITCRLFRMVSHWAGHLTTAFEAWVSFDMLAEGVQ